MSNVVFRAKEVAKIFRGEGTGAFRRGTEAFTMLSAFSGASLMCCFVLIGMFLAGLMNPVSFTIGWGIFLGMLGMSFFMIACHEVAREQWSLVWALAIIFCAGFLPFGRIVFVIASFVVAGLMTTARIIDFLGIDK